VIFALERSVLCGVKQSKFVQMQLSSRTATMPDNQSEYLSRPATAAKLGMMVRGRAYNERTLINWELDGKGPPVTR
jgi:hypothetical protein